MKQKCLGFKTSIQATFKPDSCKLLLVESIKCDSGKYGIIRPEKWVKKQLQTGQQVKSFISTTNVCKENNAGRSIRWERHSQSGQGVEMLSQAEIFVFLEVETKMTYSIKCKTEDY